MPPTVKSGYMLDFFPGVVPQVGDALVVVCRRLYEVDPVEAVARAAAEQPPPVAADELFDGDDPLLSSPRLESEMAPYKPRVDVVLVATAYAPTKKGSKKFQVTAQVGRYKRSLQVFGPRAAVWQPPQTKGRGKSRVELPTPPLFTEPTAIKTLPLTYEHAYGGVAVFLPPDEEVYKETVAALEAKQAEEKAKQEEEKKAQEAAALEAEKDAQQAEFEAAAPAEDFFSASGADALGSGEEARPKRAGSGTLIVNLEDLKEEASMDDDAGDESRETVASDEFGQVVAESVVEVRERLSQPLEDAVLDRGAGGDAIRIKRMGKVVHGDDAWVERAKAGLPVTPRTTDTGPDPFEGLPKIPCPTNPVGKGFVLSHEERVLDGLALPQIEAPNRLLTPGELVRSPATLMEGLPTPAGFGYVGKGWHPRSALAGVPPGQVEAARDQLDKLLVEMDPEDPEQRLVLESMLDHEPSVLQDDFFNGAPAEFQVPELVGDERVVLTNMSESGQLMFTLPGDVPLVTLDRGQGPEPVAMRLDTLCVLADELQASCVWRGCVPISSPEELVDYPHILLDVSDSSLQQQKALAEEALRASRVRRGGVTRITALDADEQAVDDAGSAAGAGAEPPEGESAPAASDELPYDEDGTLRLEHEGDVVQSSDAWIERARAGEKVDEEAAARAERQAKKGALREKLKAMKEAEEAPEKKGRGKKKSASKSRSSAKGKAKKKS